MRVQIPNEIIEPCRIIHIKTGLFFNGYDEYDNVLSKGKNTLSKTNAKKYIISKKEDDVILRKAFEGNIVMRNDKECIRNIIVYSVSEIHKILSKFYDEYELLPLEDFMVDRM